MKKLLLTLLTVLALSFNLSAFDFGITGTGTTATEKGNATSFGAGLRFEQFVYNDTVSVGLNQGISYDSATENVRGSTELFTAYNINYKVLGVNNTLFAGGDARADYGNSTAWYAGPLLGNRLFLTKNVYILTQANYDVGLNNTATDGLRYTLGLCVRFR